MKSSFLRTLLMFTRPVLVFIATLVGFGLSLYIMFKALIILTPAIILMFTVITGAIIKVIDVFSEDLSENPQIKIFLGTSLLYAFIFTTCALCLNYFDSMGQIQVGLCSAGVMIGFMLLPASLGFLIVESFRFLWSKYQTCQDEVND